uniref:LamG domain-containing protein n=1 Tax=Ningiella ruwaisensis TaxID=2364274 RepID=UPI00109EFE5F|nr:LamG domain-containing protein [Ningiella ruwaisensis]
MAITATDWSKRVEITPQAPAGTINGFTAVITEDNLPSEIWANSENGGGDLRVCLNDDGSNQIPLDIAKFDNVAQEAQLWIRIPALSASTKVWLFYGKSGETKELDASAYGRNSVWQEYLAAYHLNEMSQPLIDSSAGANLSINSNVSINQPGKLGMGVSTSDDNTGGLSGQTGNTSSFSEITLQAWVKINGVMGGGPNSIINFGGNNGAQLYYRSSPDTFSLQTGNSVEIRSNSTLADSSNTWVMLHATLSATNRRIYFDGSLDVSTGGASASSATDGELYVGGANGSTFVRAVAAFRNSSIDEVRVRLSALSAEHIAAEYANQNNPATYWTVGTPESIGGTITEYTLAIDSGAYIKSGQTLSLLANRTIQAESVGYNKTGNNIDLLHNKVLSADSGAYSKQPTDLSLLYNRALSLQSGSYQKVGSAMNFTYSGAPSGSTVVADYHIDYDSVESAQITPIVSPISGSNKLALLFLSWETAQAPLTASATWGGKSFSSVAVNRSGGAGAENASQILIIKHADYPSAGGPINISIDSSIGGNNLSVSLMQLSDVDQTTPIASILSDTESTGSILSVDMPHNSGQRTIACYHEGNGHSMSDNGDVQYHYASRDNFNIGLFGFEFTDSGTQTHTVTNNTASFNRGLLSVVLINPAVQVASYTLELNSGVYLQQGEALDLLHNKRIQAQQGYYLLSGDNISLLHNKRVSLQSGAYSITGSPVSFDYQVSASYRISLDSGLIELAGQNVDLRHNKRIDIQTSNYTSSGLDIALFYNRAIAIAQGSYAVIGQDIDTLYNRTFTLESGRYDYTGTSVNLDYSGFVEIRINGYRMQYKPTEININYHKSFASAQYKHH